MREGLLRSPFRRTLLDQRRALLGYSIGLALYAAMLALFWPSVEAEAAKFEQLLEAYPPALRAAFGIESLATGAGFMEAEIYSAMAPLLVLIYAIGRASDVIAGEEDRGQLELALATPVRRAPFLLQKAAGVAVGVVLLSLVLFVVLSVADLALAMGIGTWNLLAATAQLAFLSLAGGALALAVGAWSGRRGLAIGIASGVMVASFLLDVLSKLASWAEDVKWVSLFHYYSAGEPLHGGFDPVGLAVFAVLAAALVAFATWAFERRDVGV